MGGRHEQKMCSIDGSVLHQKTFSLYKDFSKGSPEMNDTGHLLQVRDSGIGLVFYHLTSSQEEG